MSDVKWTEDQRKVIDLRDRNILVSAAAGSGKTAVLVERIITRITEENPVDIDKIVVVTFTNAAAAEMRERIANAIEKKIKENPNDENLERQATLVHSAQITTIDSFCLFIVKNHFEEIGVDPNFRIADEGELKLLEEEVLAELFEKNYQEKNEAFIDLIDTYSKSKSDEAVREMVKKIYDSACSNSWPYEWLEGIKEGYKADTVEEFSNAYTTKRAVESSKLFIKGYLKELELLRDICLEPTGPDMYLDAFTKDIDLLSKVEEFEEYQDFYDFFKSFKYATLGRKSNTEVDENKKNYVKNKRDSIKKQIDSIKKSYFEKSAEELVEQNKRVRRFIEELIRLTVEFKKSLDAEKIEKRILHFSDIEHYALQILVDKDTKQLTQTALSFRDHFAEIMVDEYQDSNQIQEDILRAISGESKGANNMFMVGDVKQSIYRFRMAKPELFMHKYNSFTLEDSPNQKIDLHKNFRSREEVIDFSNDIFYKIMQKDLGNVAYDDEAALYLGANYPESDQQKPEVLLFDMGDEMLEAVVEDEDLDKARVEALMVAQRIKDLVENQMVTDKKTGELRPAKFSDIVILMRSISSTGNDFVQILEQCGIPAFVDSTTGYFAAYEVQIILAMLRILDNPYQDINMATVLKSPIVGLDNEELAEISILKEASFSHCALKAMEDATEGKLFEFNKVYKKLRALVSDTPIHAMIQAVLAETYFDAYAAAMPAGKRRTMNIETLIQKAIDYERTSFKGLYHFIRYIDLLQSYSVDSGEADRIGEDEDVVRIMTIHKSKGLEFPIVFVSAIGKQMNRADYTANLVVHSDLGIGINEMTINPRTKNKMFYREIIADTIKKDGLGEELRVLYVALTRAKEKLIMTGTISDAKKINDYKGNVKDKMPIDFVQRYNVTRYLDWIVPAVLSYPDKYELKIVDSNELATKEVSEIIGIELDKHMLLKCIDLADDSVKEEISKAIEFEYPHKNEQHRKSKYSVSDLKHDSMVEAYDRKNGEVEVPDFVKEEDELYIPKFALADEELSKNTEVNPGALRGTAVHRVMECMDFSTLLELDRTDEKKVHEFVVKLLEDMLKKQQITEEMHKLVIPKMIETFIQNDIALRMAKADSNNKLYKEKPFVMDYEGVLLQGIIDVFWIEEDKIVLLDYKTDRVENGQELAMRYKTQLDLYADALTRIFSTEEQKMELSEELLYSFRLKEVIKL